ncbi:MAG: hypothetical protein RJA70_3310 [Pseudomonadota bacterium]|jgi:inward rectifier potassium channel
MRSRWFHAPIFHTPSHELEKKVTWLELFYDLIFVAAFIQLGNSLSEHITPEGVMAFGAVFVTLWVAWTGFTFYENRYSIDDFVHRLCVFAQMFAVGGMALGAGTVLDGAVVPFALSAGAAQLLVGVMYMRARQQLEVGREYSTYWGTVFLLSGLLWVGSVFVPPGLHFWVWGLATVTVIAAPLNKRSLALADRFPIDFEHLAERYGLLTLIVLGESFVKVLSALAVEQRGPQLYVETGVMLLITCGIWWIYFDGIAGAKIKEGRARWVIWLYGHIPLQMGIVAVGVSIKKAMHFTFDEPAPDKYRWLLAGFLALVLFSAAVLDSVTERKNATLSDRSRVTMRWVSGAVILLLAPAGRTLSGGMFLVLLTGVIVSQVLFDMMTAPMEESKHVEQHKQSIANLAKAQAHAGAHKKPPADLRNAVRKGAPSEFRSDLYYYFMEGGWPRVFAAFGFMFLLSNVLFAAIYLLEPGSVANADPGSFADAFFFSVQTMSTVGYGAMVPATTYGHLVMTLQVAMSVIGIAIASGVVFAKVSRPKTSVLFSDAVVISQMNGKPCLIMRVGNARGAEIVDATASLVVMKDEFSSEGNHLRRLHDLTLMRSRTPIFGLTWTVIHVLDEHSPLYGADWSRPNEVLVSMIATLVGHDATYGQTIHSRRIYRASEFRHGHRFVDVLEQLEDGRMMVDYHRFHDTVADEAQASASVTS